MVTIVPIPKMFLVHMRHLVFKFSQPVYDVTL